MTNNFNARSISRDNHEALLVVCVGVIWITFAKNEVDFCPGIACTADVPGGDVSTFRRLTHRKRTNEPLVSINDYFFPLLPDGRANIRGIGRSNFRVGQIGKRLFDL
jgi:hypothetical protein